MRTIKSMLTKQRKLKSIKKNKKIYSTKINTNKPKKLIYRKTRKSKKQLSIYSLCKGIH